VGPSTDLTALESALGKEKVAVAPLPASLGNAAGPFLTTETFFFSTASSPAQHQRSLLLAQFLTNPEQQRRLAQQAGRIPANQFVRINRRISPAVASFVEQSKTAVPLLLKPQIADTIVAGRETYIQVLEGQVSSAEGARELTEIINQRFGKDTVDIVTELTCTEIGRIEVWHSWLPSHAAFLESLGDEYSQICPAVTLAFTYAAEDDLLALYRQAVLNGGGPDLLLTGNRNLTDLAVEGFVTNINDLIELETFQRYLPTISEALSYEDNLHGIPISLQTQALYYNPKIIDRPPADLGDLLSQVSPTTSLVIAYTPYENMHWGVGGFGGKIYDAEGNLALEEGKVSEWLGWLQQIQNQPGIILVNRPTDAVAMFARGDVAYLVGNWSSLGDLEAEMGRGGVQVAVLPAGPEGAATPILSVESFMLNPNSVVASIATEFAKFVSDVENQNQLVQNNRMLPVNTNVTNLDDYPVIASFVEQAATGVRRFQKNKHPRVSALHKLRHLDWAVRTQLGRKRQES